MPIRPLTRLAAVAALAVTAVALSGCATAASSASTQLPGTVPELKKDQKVSIVFESYNLAQAGVWSDTINGLVSDFEKEHPNITVKAQPTQNYSASNTNTVGSLQTQLLAGSIPDVAQVTFDSLDFAVNQLGAQPLEKLFGTKAIEDDFGGKYPVHPKAAALGDWDGQTYALPYVFSTPVLWYNATALEAAGIPANPDMSTWAKVKAIAEQVTAKTGKPAITISCAVKGGSWCMQGLIRSDGGEVLSADRKKIEFGDAGAVDAVSTLRDLYDDGVLANLDSASQIEAFSRGDSVIQLQTSVEQSSYMAAAKAGGWELKNTTMPAFGDKPTVPTNSGSALFLFSKDPAKQRAAWEFMQYMTSAHANEVITKGIGYLPLRTTLTQGDGPLAEWAASNPLLKPNLDQLDHLEPWTSYPGNSYVQIDDILATAIEDSIFYGKDPKSTLADAQKRAQALIDN